MKIKKFSGGFTLIELLVVISIIGLLTSIVLANLSASRDKAKKAAGQLFIAHNTQALYADASLLYSFDEGAGTVTQDGSGLGNNGTLTSGPIWTTNGKNGGALIFDGTDDYVQFPNNFYTPGNESFTLAAWFNLSSSVSATNQWFSIFGSPQSVPTVGYNPVARQFYHHHQDGALSEPITWTVPSSPNLADDTWHHVLLTVNQSTTPRTVELYFDGQSLGRKDLANYGYTGNGNIVRIGRSWTGNNLTAWKGMIDEVGLYRRFLTK